MWPEQGKILLNTCINLKVDKLKNGEEKAVSLRLLTNKKWLHQQQLSPNILQSPTMMLTLTGLPLALAF